MAFPRLDLKAEDEKKVVDYSKTPIPKKMHYIWVGGPIKEEYLDNILKMARVAEESGFELNVWVDDEKNITKPLQKRMQYSLDNPVTKSKL